MKSGNKESVEEWVDIEPGVQTASRYGDNDARAGLTKSGKSVSMIILGRAAGILGIGPGGFAKVKYRATDGAIRIEAADTGGYRCRKCGAPSDPNRVSIAFARPQGWGDEPGYYYRLVKGILVRG